MVNQHLSSARWVVTTFKEVPEKEERNEIIENK
jgi:hypothetical protein